MEGASGTIDTALMFRTQKRVGRKEGEGGRKFARAASAGRKRPENLEPRQLGRPARFAIHTNGNVADKRD